jgi:hypothetical protein
LRRYFDAASSTEHGELPPPAIFSPCSTRTHILISYDPLLSGPVPINVSTASIPVPPRLPTPHRVPRAAPAPCHAPRYALTFGALASGDGVTHQRALGGRTVAHLLHTTCSARSMLTGQSPPVAGHCAGASWSPRTPCRSSWRACYASVNRPRFGRAREARALGRGCCARRWRQGRRRGNVFGHTGARLGPHRLGRLLSLLCMIYIGYWLLSKCWSR